MDFAEECRLKCSRKKSVRNVSFDSDYPLHFTATFSDSSSSNYKIQTPTAVGSVIRQSSYLENVDVKEDGVLPLTDNEGDGLIAAHRSASLVVELTKGSMDGERWRDEIAPCLPKLDGEWTDWASPSFKERFKLCCLRLNRGNALMVGNWEDDSSDCTCVYLCSNYQTREETTWPDRLKGSDATFSDDGTFIVTWDGCTSDDSGEPKMIYIYETADFDGEVKVTIWRRTWKEGSRESTSCPPQRTYKVPDDRHLLQARLLPIQNGSSAGVPSLMTASLLMLCQVRWSDTAKIFVMSLKTETICFRLDFGESFVQELESPKQLVKRLSDQNPFVLSPNQKWIYLSKSDQKKGTVYSVKDGYPVLEVDWSDDDDFEPLRSKFDPSGRFLVLEDGKRMKIFVLNEHDDIVDAAIREVVSPDAYSVLRFYAQYDRRKMGKMLSEALSLRGDLGSRVTTMMGGGLFAAIRDKMEFQADAHFVDVIVSPDRSLVAFVVDGDIVSIEIFSCKEDVRGTDMLCRKTRVEVPELVLLDAYGDRFGMFTKRGDCREFTYLNPQAENVIVVKIDIDDESTPRVSDLSKREGTFLSVMKLTADGSKALVVYHNGKFLVLSLEKGVRTWMKGSFACEAGVHTFVNHFLRDAFIHISEDDRTMTIGWDSVAHKPLSIPLNAGSRTTAAAINKVVRHTALSNLGNILWMNRSRTRAIVSATREDVDSLIVYSISGKFSVLLELLTGDAQIRERRKSFNAALLSFLERQVSSLSDVSPSPPLSSTAEVSQRPELSSQTSPFSGKKICRAVGCWISSTSSWTTLSPKRTSPLILDQILSISNSAAGCLTG